MCFREASSSARFPPFLLRHLLILIEYVSPGVSATIEKDTSEQFHGFASQKISRGPGNGIAVVENRGLGSEGLYIEGGKEYEGYFFAKSPAAVELVVRLVDMHTNTTLGAQILRHAGGSAWAMHNFSGDLNHDP